MGKRFAKIEFKVVVTSNQLDPKAFGNSLIEGFGSFTVRVPLSYGPLSVDESFFSDGPCPVRLRQ